MVQTCLSGGNTRLAVWAATWQPCHLRFTAHACPTFGERERLQLPLWSSGSGVFVYKFEKKHMEFGEVHEIKQYMVLVKSLAQTSLSRHHVRRPLVYFLDYFSCGSWGGDGVAPSTGTEITAAPLFSSMPAVSWSWSQPLSSCIVQLMALEQEEREKPQPAAANSRNARHRH